MLNVEKLGPEITWYVTVGTEQYEVQAYSAQSAVRKAMIAFLDVALWDDENRGLFLILDLADILETLPEDLEVYAVPDIDEEFVTDDEGSEDPSKLLN